MDQPEPFASIASTMPVVEAVMSVDSSVWTSGRCVDDDGDPLLHDRDVAAEKEAEAPEALLALGDLGETGGRRERLEGPGDDPPASSDEILVVEVEESRVVVAPERPPLRPRPGQGDERGVVHRALPRLGERAPHALAGRGRRARIRSRGAVRPARERPPGVRSRGTRWTSAPRPRWRGGVTRRRAARAAGRWPRRRPRPRGRRARCGGARAPPARRARGRPSWVRVSGLPALPTVDARAPAEAVALSCRR